MVADPGNKSDLPETNVTWQARATVCSLVLISEAVFLLITLAELFVMAVLGRLPELSIITRIIYIRKVTKLTRTGGFRTVEQEVDELSRRKRSVWRTATTHRRLSVMPLRLSAIGRDD